MFRLTLRPREGNIDEIAEIGWIGPGPNTSTNLSLRGKNHGVTDLTIAREGRLRFLLLS